MKVDQLNVEQRLMRMEATEDIRILKARYARALDDRYNSEAVSALFSDDGQWLVKGVAGSVKGREAIKRHCDNLRSDIFWTFHNINPHIIEVSPDGQNAVGSFYFQGCQTMKNEAGEDEAYVLLGEYDDKFVKINDEWFFQAILATVIQAAPWSDGWVKSTYQPKFFDVK